AAVGTQLADQFLQLGATRDADVGSGELLLVTPLGLLVLGRLAPLGEHLLVAGRDVAAHLGRDCVLALGPVRCRHPLAAGVFLACLKTGLSLFGGLLPLLSRLLRRRRGRLIPQVIRGNLPTLLAELVVCHVFSFVTSLGWG